MIYHIKETIWNIEIDVSEDPVFKQKGLKFEENVGFLYDESVIKTYIEETKIWAPLKEAGKFKIKLFTAKTYAQTRKEIQQKENNEDFEEYDPTSDAIIETTKTGINENGKPVIILPKQKLKKLKTELKKANIPHTFTPMVYPKAQLTEAFKPFKNPAHRLNPQTPEKSKLQNFQIGAFSDFSKHRGSGIFNMGMGGGKGLIIVKLLQMFPDLRPALVTSAASADSQQLAATIAYVTGEPTKLVGCKSGALTTQEKKTLFAKLQDAKIIVSSHKIFDQLKNYDENKTPVTTKIEEIILNSKIIILDEIHEAATTTKIENLTKTNPKIAFGLTATWKKNWNQIDRILAAHFSTENEVITTISHKEIQDQQRVTPVEIYGYSIDRDSPEYRLEPKLMEQNRFRNYLQRYVEYNPKHTRFVARLCKHLLEKNAEQQRGTILAFVDSIQHGEKVLRELAEIKGIKTKEEDLQNEEIYIYNAQISNAQKTARLQAMRERRTKIVISTESLARGIDMSSIYDIVDLTGGSAIVNLIQKSGRAVRPEDNKTARIHFVKEGYLNTEDTSKYQTLLSKISQKKQNELQTYFHTTATIYDSKNLPWLHKKSAMNSAGKFAQFFKNG